MAEIPAELTARPLALIGMVGLELSNPIHHSIWDAFNSNRRPDGASVQFKLISSSHEFPTVKPKVSFLNKLLKILFYLNRTHQQ